MTCYLLKVVHLRESLALAQGGLRCSVQVSTAQLMRVQPGPIEIIYRAFIAITFYAGLKPVAPEKTKNNALGDSLRKAV
jgi:hypothetical protein